MSSTAWGEDTQYFFALTPDKILDAVEASGLRCTGRCLPLNSMENRVYEVELEIDDPSTLTSVSEKFRIAKFYRPGRWSREQILEEHAFLLELKEAEIPVAAPLVFEDGLTLHQVEDTGIFYSIFAKVGGRSPDELNVDQLEQVGRLLARMHNVGAAKEAEHRITINPEVYGRYNLEFLLSSDLIPRDLRDRYKKVVEDICDISEPLFANTAMQRIHGDAHLGNLLSVRGSFFWVDFDDMVKGPPVQDIWLATPGRDAWGRAERDILIEGYEQMREFDHTSLRLIEPLRALRFIHFNAWIGKRWEDPSFPRAFPHYGTYNYWIEELAGLDEQLQMIRNAAESNAV
ncbi:MAG TPA: serine/threonine protein kinase [Myxococcales bacterium]|nr:serine/threonine protein kinase [Deltaproteobacteria bacterium]HAA59184.1 serine/threonine protein kinase [Myxococcales bacterium]|tara:strand:- start:6559 stop:7593 length:1035 start_codon:yes stop_codon:yes gene_type:complete